MKSLIAVFFIAFSIQAFAQEEFNRGTGLIFDDAAYKKAPRLSPALRFSDQSIPQVYSLKKFCPTAGDQGHMSSCVGWSVGYAGLTISYAVKYKLTSQSEINKHAKSALFIYNQCHKPEALSRCENGLNMERTFQWLTTYGDCDNSDFNPTNCVTFPPDRVKKLADDFPIANYNTLFDQDDGYERKVSAIINSLSQNKPVMAGFSATESLQTVGSTGIWAPRPGEIDLGGHAMCIVGYDNIKEQFEILNSWSVLFGNRGYFKMSYRDLAKYCKYGYNVTLGYTREELAKMQTLTGNFSFKKFLRVNDASQQNEFTSVNPFLNGSEYTFREGSVKKDDFYRLVVSNMQKDSYLYIFSLKPNHTAEVLFPLSASSDSSQINDLPIIPASGASVELPADDSKAYSTDMAGEDVLCLLYSSQKIPDIKNISLSVNLSSGDLLERLHKALGSRLVPRNQIRYSSSDMSFSTTTMTGNIVPIILKVAVTQ